MASSSNYVEHKEWISQAFSDKIVNRCGFCSKDSANQRCSRCKEVFYCDATCQKEHWQDHKVYCSVTIDGILDFLRSDWIPGCLPPLTYIRNRLRTMIPDLSVIEYVIDLVRMSQPTNIVDNGLIKDETPTNACEYLSGCDSVHNLLYMLCMNRRTRTINPEMVAQLCLIDAVMHTAPDKVERPIVYTSLSSKNTFTEKGLYYAQVALAKDFHHLSLALPKQSSVVLINIRDERDAGLGREWKDQLDCASTNHYLLLITTTGGSVIVQSYYGHYTFREWCDFERPLKQIEAPPAPADFFCPINPRPAFRGKLSSYDHFRFLNSLERLTQERDDHHLTYERITGILLKPSEMKKSYTIRYTCLNLNQIIF